jgi:alkylation response protein AidB-like acyl-CoA dehydrogenase
MMQTPDSPEIKAFRQQVRDFLAARLSPELRARVLGGHYLSKDELLGWHRELYRQGWVAQEWPVEYGGTGWSPLQKYVFEEELAEAGAPILIPMGLYMVGPLLIAYGSEEQKARFLPRILDGSEVWCQGFSEPGSGSDLASLRCAARLEGDTYVVSGTKIWTTSAHWSDWCLLLTRTGRGQRKHDGITILLVDMRLPGISIRPIPSLDGYHSLNQVFFDDVRVPANLRVGPQDGGWRLLMSMIGKERIMVADVGRTKAMLYKLKRIAAEEVRDGVRLIDTPRFRDRIARAEIDVMALEMTVLRMVNDPDLAKRPEASLLKIRGTEVQQALTRLLSEAVGQYAIPYSRDVLTDGWGGEPIGPDYAATLTPFYFFWRKSSISAGTNEIQRNIMARALLGKD